MRSLYARLTLIFLLVLLLAGGIILWVVHQNNRQHFLEFTQRLNSPIAMYMAQNANLSIDDALNHDALSALAPHVMTINPSVDVYLLDAAGHIAAHSLTESDLQRKTISLEPLHQFMQPDVTYPLLGDNPKDASQQRIFSAHPLTSNTETIGYVYAVLSGDQHDSLFESLSDSYSFKNLIVSLATILLLALAMGSLLFFIQIRRLRSLQSRVRRWQQNHGLIPHVESTHTRPFSDELDELHVAYESMASQLLDQYQLLANSDQQRRELFANISHDLRTPLTTLHGYLDTLVLKQNELSADDRWRYLQVAHRQSTRLRRLVSQLFQLATLSDHGFTLKREPFSLLELAYDITQDFTLEAERLNVNLGVESTCAQGERLQVYADIELVHRVFENLLSNALRYTEPNGQVRICLSLTPDRRTVKVNIEDTGPGIDFAQNPHCVLKRYSRVKNIHSPAVSQHPTQDQQHVGLGLAIVHRVLELHGADISVSNLPQRGCRVSFNLPCTIPEHERAVA